jgi:hypothetical protein
MRVVRVFLAGMFVLPAACQSRPETPAATEVAGECTDVFGGQVCTWAEMEGTQVLSLGATIPMAAIENAPSDAPMVFPPVANGIVQLPEPARQATGLTHLTIYWEAHGHPPGTFMTPHFDFHFYGISPDQRLSIDCSNLAKPATLPAGYLLPDEQIPDGPLLVGICVPQMGMHALVEQQYKDTATFGATMVVGYYNGDVIFTEPMVARDLLLKRADFTLPMPALTAPAPVRYPTEFRAVYDSAAASYRFTFSGFTAGH